ncbi:MAG: helix-turn-helix transcriptional regulator [Anaerolineae bacterium]|nr:helix-turn-helix transcriptional regulator [Anaerolineae bacterium]
MSSLESPPQLLWDIGTAYDLFMSLTVLHDPENFGLRGAWAAGVRSRLPAPDREILQQVSPFYEGAMQWVYSLPRPKDSATALQHLAQLSPQDRIRTLFLSSKVSNEARTVLEGVALRSQWTKPEQKLLRSALREYKFSANKVNDVLNLWENLDEAGERYLKALQTYYEVFFAEEEIRIRPALDQAVERSQELAEKLDVPELLEALSEGFRFGDKLRVSEVVLIPSFWITPLICDLRVSAEKMLFVFGGRPGNASLVPGEVVPDALFHALKALADPTRLRILRYLTTEPLTPAQLARRLRLRAPTVVHHLRALRLAGLVYLTLEAGYKVHYAARSEAVDAMSVSLKEFLEQDLVGRQ